MRNSKPARVLSLIFVLLTLCSGTFVHSQAPAAPRMAQIRLFLIGYGARYVIAKLSRMALEKPEIRAALEKKIPSKFIGGKDETAKREILARTLTVGLLAAMGDYFENIFQESGFTATSASALKSAFIAGEKAPLLMKFLLSGWQAVPGIVMTSAELLKQTGYATIGNMKRALDDFLAILGPVASATSLEEAWNKFITAYQVTPRDLAYPLKSYHGTALTCGTNNPYCLPEQSAYAQEAHEMGVDPDAIALGMTNLLAHAASVQAGILLANLSFYIATELAGTAGTAFLYPHFSRQTSILVEKMLRRYVDLTLFNYMFGWVLEVINKSDKTLVTAQDLKASVVTGTLGQLARAGVGPIEKRFLKTLVG